MGHLPVLGLAHHRQKRIRIRLLLNGQSRVPAGDFGIASWRDIALDWRPPLSHELITNKLYQQAEFLLTMYSFVIMLLS